MSASKRAASPPKDEKRARKTHRSSSHSSKTQLIKGILEELTCPITCELCVEPVIAEDGHLYEKSAIERYFKHRATADLKSPVTNKAMGRSLRTARLARSIIERVMQSRVLDKTETLRWRALNHEVKNVEPLMEEIQTGSVDAMVKLGLLRFDGNPSHDGLEPDYKDAFQWFSKAAELNHPGSIAMKGKMLCDGLGCEQDVSYGLTCLAEGAGMGSAYACHVLGFAHKTPKWGLPALEKHTRHWYNKALNAKINDLYPAQTETIKQWLAEHPEAE